MIIKTRTAGKVGVKESESTENLKVRIQRRGKLVGTRDLRTVSTFAEELSEYLPAYIIALAKEEGVEITSKSTVVPLHVALKIESQFRALLK